jgi:hypothetical protein
MRLWLVGSGVRGDGDPDVSHGFAVRELAPGAVMPRIVQSGAHLATAAILLVDEDRLFSASAAGVHVMRR